MLFSKAVVFLSVSYVVDARLHEGSKVRDLVETAASEILVVLNFTAANDDPTLVETLDLHGIPEEDHDLFENYQLPGYPEDEYGLYSKGGKGKGGSSMRRDDEIPAFLELVRLTRLTVGFIMLPYMNHFLVCELF